MRLIRVDRTLLDEAKVAFRPARIVPDMSRDKIMMDAGAQLVLEFLEERLAKTASTDIVGGAEKEVEVVSPMEAAMRRALST